METVQSMHEFLACHRYNAAWRNDSFGCSDWEVWSVPGDGDPSRFCWGNKGEPPDPLPSKPW